MPEPTPADQFYFPASPPPGPKTIAPRRGIRWEFGCLLLLVILLVFIIAMMFAAGPQLAVTGARLVERTMDNPALEQQLLLVSELIWPASAELQDALGQASLRQGDLAAAIQGFNRAILLAPELATAHNNLGVALQRAGQPEAAIAAFQQAASLDTANPQLLLNLAGAQLATARPAQALAAAQRAAALEPDLVQAWLLAGQSALFLKDFEQAQGFFDRALSLDAGYAPALTGLGIVRLQQGRPVEAMQFLRAASQLDPLDPYPHFLLGIALENQGLAESASNAYQQALSLQPPIELEAQLQSRLEILQGQADPNQPAQGGEPSQTP